MKCLLIFNVYNFKNLAEAEYCVSVYMYMRLIGYPASKITILSTYNGQKHLIREIINMRCGSNPLIGWPHKVIINILLLLSKIFIFFLLLKIYD